MIETATENSHSLARTIENTAGGQQYRCREQGHS